MPIVMNDSPSTPNGSRFMYCCPSIVTSSATSAPPVARTAVEWLAFPAAAAHSVLDVRRARCWGIPEGRGGLDMDDTTTQELTDEDIRTVMPGTSPRAETDPDTMDGD